ncbi:MAG TPA: TolC family protein [Gemmataceae bacterium]|nr:TolC family protein [Gemmataceae bacterium]
MRAGPGFALALALVAGLGAGAPAQETAPAPRAAPPAPFEAPAPEPGLRPLPINLPTALKLAGARAIDVAAASARLQVAAAQLNQAQVLWLPTVTVGGDYFRHDGRIQDVQGNVFDTSKGSLMFGAGSGIGPAAVLSINDALFAPLAARQVVRAREADLRAAANDTVVAVTQAYFDVQQARGELAGAAESTRRADELVRRTEALAQGLVPPLEYVRAQAELARRQEAELFARERWRVAGAELLRVLRLDPAAQVEPLEPPSLRVELVRLDGPVDDLIGVALTNRPELAAQQALVQASLQLLRQERLRPLVPSVLLRGASTTVTGTLMGGVFGGGLNGSLNNFAPRLDADVQLLWQLDNLGFGNRARVGQRKAENWQATVELFRLQDRVAAEAAQAFARAQLAARRAAVTERGLRYAAQSAEMNLAGLSQTRRAGDLVLLVIRPQEVVAAVQALAQAYAAYYGAVADSNRAQFQLYRALGQPAELLLPGAVPPAAAPACVNFPPPGLSGPALPADSPR